MWTMLSPSSKQSHGCSCQGSKATTTPELSGTFRTLPPEPTPTRAGTLQNPPEPSETFRNQPLEPSGTYLLNLCQHKPEPSEIFRNLPPEPAPFYTGTLRNLPPEPSPAHAGTLRNLPEPSSGTCSCDTHRHTPGLIWAEDPISLGCWGINNHCQQDQDYTEYT